MLIVIALLTFIKVNEKAKIITINEYLFPTGGVVTGAADDLASAASNLIPDVAFKNQEDLVPITVVLFLIGWKSAGAMVHYRFVMRYATSCHRIAFREGDVPVWRV